ncbi:hypothetical protein B9Z55_003334 [Caenorhabditis nigoni]|uniref:Uncharacterized protein n=1 Tax=Caenorhabditis nigoni TaxID=1611254 RepID=A0A2G5VQF0_9PELO|nr:hypothetical protein B9Z55_003334 [Caenorhabditis nigoni]
MSSTTPLTATSTNQSSSNKQQQQIPQSQFSVRHMPGSTRPLTVIPCPNGWTEWRCVHKTYTRYPPSRQLL